MHRLADPFLGPDDLGIVPVQGFSDSFDAEYWPTYEGNNVHRFALKNNELVVRAQHETFWPVRIEHIPEGIWLERSSLGMEHFDVLSVPDLELIKSGDLVCSNIEFPPEQIPHTAWGPTLALPVVAVHAAGIPRSLGANDEVVEHPVRNADRIIVPNGPVITTLPAPSAGLVAAGERALCWFRTENAMEFVLVCLVTASVKYRFSIIGATEAGARICGRDIVVWERDTLRVFHDGDTASSSRN